jgi:hypothetical protein
MAEKNPAPTPGPGKAKPRTKAEMKESADIVHNRVIPDIPALPEEQAGPSGLQQTDRAEANRRVNENFRKALNSLKAQQAAAYADEAYADEDTLYLEENLEEYE